MKHPASDHLNVAFLAHAFAGVVTDEVPWVAGFPGDPHKVDHWLWGGRPAFPLPSFIYPKHNNYVAVSSFKRSADGTYHRRKDNFIRMHLVMVDDVGTKVPHDKLALQPSALVETSPGNFQAWYFLYPPEADRNRAERLINGMIASGLTADATDPGMKGVTRYGRLPVGINGKAKYVKALGHPFVQRVASWAPQLRYSIDDIANAYGVDLSVPVTKPRSLKRVARKRVDADMADDGYVSQLQMAGLYVESTVSLSGAHRIICPWVHEHTDEDPSGTVYFEPSDQNEWRGGFKCHHGHCQARTVVDLNFFLHRLQQMNSQEI